MSYEGPPGPSCVPDRAVPTGSGPRARTHPWLYPSTPFPRTWRCSLLSVNQSTVTTFAPFFLSVPVHNNGDAAAVWRPKMVYYRSTDDLIGTSDTKVGEQQVGGVFAGTTNTYTIQLNAPSTTGTYYYGACVEPSVTYESNVANNCSVEGVQVVVN